MFVSILICTYNRCEILRRTLESLAGVVVPAGVEVELVVIANACTDETAAVAAAGLAALPFPGRCVVEPEAGLSRARNRGVAEARGDIIAFLDDDVWVERGWLEGLAEVYRTTPADMVSGKVDLWWEAVQRPAWVGDEMLGCFGCLDLGEEVVECFGQHDALGANFSFRRKVSNAIGLFRLDLGRTGRIMWDSEESEFIQRALTQGLRLFYAPEAHVRHWVRPERVAFEFQYRHAYDAAQSHVYVKEKFGPRAAVRAIAGHTYLMIRHGTAGWFARLRGDQPAEFFHNRRRMIGLGGVVASLRRICRISPHFNGVR